VLADMAVPLEDFDRAVLVAEIKDTEDDVADAKDDQRDKLAHRLDQLKTLQSAIGG
jgi:F0F1-type ATP synthase epsilon subunit